MQTTFPPPKPVTVISTSRQQSLLRFSPSGQFLFAAGRDGKISRWDLSQTVDPPADALEPARGKTDKPQEIRFAELPALAGHDGWVSQIVFHPQKPWCFSADTWGRLIGWNLAQEPAAPSWNLPAAHDGWLRQVALSSDGERLATCGKDMAIRIWSAADGKLLHEFRDQADEVFSVAFHPDGKSLVAGDLKGVVKQWDLAETKVTREFDAKILYFLSYIQDVGGVRVLAFDPEGKSLAVAGGQPTSGAFVQAMPTLKFFNWATGQETQSLKLGENTEGFVHDLAFHPEGYWIGATSGQPGRGSYFFQRPGEEKPFFSLALPNCHSVALHPDGKRFAVAANAGTYGQSRSMARQGIYPGNTSPIHLLELTPAMA